VSHADANSFPQLVHRRLSEVVSRRLLLLLLLLLLVPLRRSGRVLVMLDLAAKAGEGVRRELNSMLVLLRVEAGRGLLGVVVEAVAGVAVLTAES
jgi:hypothetical protein